MATVVLVHGIAQEQEAAPVLESRWLPALAGGVATWGDKELSDKLWRDKGPGSIEVRMAYYGKPFIDEGAQGDGGVDLDTEPIPAGAEDLLPELAKVWLEAAAQAASDPTDKRTAQDELDILAGTAGIEQGARALVRPILNALAELRWFAPAGMAIAGKFVWTALTQVSRYLTDETIRSYAQQQVLQLIDADTKLVIGHSLGSVVAYEALHRTQHRVALITLGSPLGLRNVIYDKLSPQPPHVPASVTRWENFADEDDLVAARLDLKPQFGPAPGSNVTPVSHIVDTGSKPHDVGHYLTKRSCGRVVAETLRA
jgi:pimeloyl-ACP methyl ester carboxylesterase